MAKITYTHKKNSRSKSLKISVSGTGEVILTTPPFTPKFLADRFIQTNSHWIELQKRKIASVQSNILTDTSVVIFGKKYLRSDTFSKKIPIGIHVQGEKVIHNSALSPELNSAQEITQSFHKNMNRFLKRTASSYILPRTKSLAQKMATTYEAITLKEQKTRWGSCSSKGNLNFNWRLAHFEPPIIDYVIIHELAHRTHMDHSHAFWNLVETFDPEYRIKRGWLKRNGLSLS